MATNTQNILAQSRVKKVTSIGHSVRSKPKSKHATKKRYRGQGK